MDGDPVVGAASVILSDRSIREALDAGHIVIDPLDEGAVQPSSVDLRLGHGFRVFRNHTMSHIDVKQDLSELTSLVQVNADDPFILHPGEFVLGATLERVASARRPGGPPGGQVVAGPPGPADPFDGGVRGPPASTASSPWSCRMSPTCRSPCTRGCA